MPQQPPDILVNEYPSVDFGALRLYTIVQGQRPARPRWNNQYPFKHRPRPSNHAVCSKLWRGYLAYYRLTPEGQLLLERYEYPFDHSQPADEVSEMLEGDFWLVMKESFYGTCTYVPFVDGRIQADRQQWQQGPNDVGVEKPRKVRPCRPRVF